MYQSCSKFENFKVSTFDGNFVEKICLEAPYAYSASIWAYSFSTCLWERPKPNIFMICLTLAFDLLVVNQQSRSPSAYWPPCRIFDLTSLSYFLRWDTLNLFTETQSENPELPKVTPTSMFNIPPSFRKNATSRYGSIGEKYTFYCIRCALFAFFPVVVGLDLRIDVKKVINGICG